MYPRIIPMEKSLGPILVVLIFWNAPLLSQTIPQNQNLVDSKGQRQGKWTLTLDRDWKFTNNKDSIAFYRLITYKDDKPVGKVSDHYQNGQVQFEGKLLNDRPDDVIDGEATWYRKDGSREVQRKFLKGDILKEVYYNIDGTEITERWKDLNAVGNAAYQGGDYPKALTYFKKAKLQAEKEFPRSDPSYAEATNNLGTAYYATGDYASAGPYYEEYLALTRTLHAHDPIHLAQALFSMGVLNLATGKYKEAMDNCLEALQVRENLHGKDHLEYGLLLTFLGVINFSTGDYDNAEAYYLDAHDVYVRTVGKEHYYYIDNLNRMAILHQTRGNFGKAEPLYVEVIAGAEKLVGKDHPFYISLRNNLATVYRDMGNFARAEPIYVENLDKIEKSLGRDHPDYATYGNNLALLYEEMGLYEKAEPLYQHVVKSFEKLQGKEHPNYIQSLSNLAVLYDELRAFDKSTPIHKEVLSLAASALGKNHGTYARYLGNLGTTYSLQERYAEAEPLYAESMTIWENAYGKNHPHYTELLCNQAVLYEHMNDFQKAASLYQQLNDVMAAQINSYFPGLSEKEKTAFYQQRVRVYVETFNSFVVKARLKNPALLGAMYNNQIATKGILFDSGNKIRKRIRGSNDESLKALYARWQSDRENLARVYQMSNEERSTQGVSIEQMENEINSLEKELSLQSGSFATAHDHHRYAWQDVRKKLARDEAAIEIMRFRTNDRENAMVYYVALIITPGTPLPEFVLFENGGDLEGRFIRYYKNSIFSRSEDLVSYKEFWAPIDVVLKKINKRIAKVYVSPDGVFHLVNLNTLMDPTKKKFLADNLSIELVSNTKDLLADKNITNSPAGVVLFGSPDYAMENLVTSHGARNEARAFETDSLSRFFNGETIPPLPGTETEVMSISALLKNARIKNEVYMQQEAREDMIKSMKDVEILHIATHGFFLRDIPASGTWNVAGFSGKTFIDNPLLRAGLLLAGAQKAFEGYRDPNSDDGILTAFEAMSLDLENTDLVILSACETGLGEVSNGEGVYGLQRAFQTAGARSVLMSLWKVDDTATQELMTTFYSNWVDMKDKQKAFTEAQRAMRKKYKHPYYWGAFALVGD